PSRGRAPAARGARRGRGGRGGPRRDRQPRGAAARRAPARAARGGRGGARSPGRARLTADLARRPADRGARLRQGGARPRRAARGPRPRPAARHPPAPAPPPPRRRRSPPEPDHPEERLMRLDALTLEILRNYLQGAVEGMAYVVERTAYTTFVKETADFTCGLLNPSGEFFAYPVELGVASFGGISYAETLEAVRPREPRH